MTSFAQVVAMLRHWMHKNRIINGLAEDEQVNITIEIATPDAGMALLYALKRELEPTLKPFMAEFGPPIELDTPMRFMGMDIVFKVKQPARPVAAHVHEIRG